MKLSKFAPLFSEKVLVEVALCTLRSNILIIVHIFGDFKHNILIFIIDFIFIIYGTYIFYVFSLWPVVNAL